MGIDELKKMRDSFLELKGKTEESYIEYTSFDADRNSFSLLTEFSKKYNMFFIAYVVLCIINIVLSSLGILSIDWLASVSSLLFAGSSITAATICRLRANKLSERDYQKKRDLCDRYLINQELCQGLAQKIIGALNDLDMDVKESNQELIDSCLEETIEYNDSNVKDVKAYIDSAILKIICSINANENEADEITHSEELPDLELEEPVEVGNTRKLN